MSRFCFSNTCACLNFLKGHVSFLQRTLVWPLLDGFYYARLRTVSRDKKEQAVALENWALMRVGGQRTFMCPLVRATGCLGMESNLPLSVKCSRWGRGGTLIGVKKVPLHLRPSSSRLVAMVERGLIGSISLLGSFPCQPWWLSGLAPGATTAPSALPGLQPAGSSLESQVS